MMCRNAQLTKNEDRTRAQRVGFKMSCWTNLSYGVVWEFYDRSVRLILERPNYTTTIILDGTDYASASALFSTVSAVVTSAVFNGNLTNYIQSAASNSNRYVL